MDTAPVIQNEPVKRTNTFPRQLRFWAMHVGLTALPSYCIALTQFHSTINIIAMLSGICTFIFGYALLTSTLLYGKVHDGLIGRSIKLGTRIRMIISLVSLPLLIPLIGYNFESSNEAPPESIVYVPDFWFGYAAIIISGFALNLISQGGMGRFGDADYLTQDFVFPYLVTVVEGILISISLVFIAFITLIILNFRRNRQQLPAQHIPQGPPGV